MHLTVCFVLYLWKVQKMKRRSKKVKKRNRRKAKKRNSSDVFDLTGCTSIQIAEKFEAWSNEFHGVYHKLCLVDGWSILRNETYERITDVKKIEIYFSRFINRCYHISKNIKMPYAFNIGLHANVMKALESFPEVYISEGKKSPSYLGSKKSPDMKNIIALNNCLLNTSKHPPQKIKLSKYYYILDRLDYEYNRKAKCPRWKKFLQEIFESEEQDDPSIKILQEFMGLLLIPETKYQKILGIVGPKRSGKGTIGRIIKELCGRQKVASVNLTDLSGSFGQQALIGKTVAIIGDAAFDSKKINFIRTAEVIKQISGEDPIAINRKYKKVKEFTRLPVRFVIIANKIQSLEDTSGALASRFIYLKTTKSFYGKEDLDLTDKLLKELPGILNWALRGLSRLKRRGYFLESSRGKEAKRITEELGSDIISFVRECCDEENGSYVKKEDLHKRYNQWAARMRKERLGRTQFYENFGSAFPIYQEAQIRVKRGNKTTRVRVFKNIDLKKKKRRIK